MEKLKNNRVLKVIWNICYTLLFILTVATLLVVLLQRFSNNSLSLGGFKIFNVVSESMAPKYVIGDVLLSKTVPIDDIKIGDDIVYNGEKGDFAGKIVTHRVIEIEPAEAEKERVFHTQGIANDTEDPTITDRQIMGTIVCKIPILSQISKVGSNIYALYFLIFVPMTILICLELRKVILHFVRKKDE